MECNAYACLLYDVTDTDWWTQNGSVQGRDFATLSPWIRPVMRPLFLVRFPLKWTEQSMRVSECSLALYFGTPLTGTNTVGTYQSVD